MADNINNDYKVQSSAKILLVDPNRVNEGVGGRVKPEDLFIYVDLKANKKPRTIISNNRTGDSINNNLENGTTIQFISQSDEPGRAKPTITTNYTRLTTVLYDKESNEPNSESFGIRDINIEFNKAMAPIVKINFVDIRGATLFERGNDSKYNVFFNLPYPIFELTVKGYYGPAVTYCLHLTKFNSKFNSKTGDFEIQCEFIGYTFAFLSDMLLGYISAVPETERGRILFEEKRAVNQELLTINELKVKLGRAKTELGKVASSEKDVKELQTIKNILDTYNTYESVLNEFISNLIEKDSFGYVGESKETLSDGTRKNTNLYIFEVQGNWEETLNFEWERLKNAAIGANREISENPQFQLNDNPQEKAIIDEFTPNDEKTISVEDETLDKFNSIKKSEGFSEKTNTHLILDLNALVTDFEQKKINAKTIIKDLLTKVSELIEQNLKQILGFDPTIRNFINIFTVHVEIYLKLIQETAIKAMGSPTRTGELDKLTDSLDINRRDIDKKTYYPFPQYNEEGVEQWIGRNIGPIPETLLVRQIFDGLIKTEKANTLLDKLLENGVYSYYPANFIDLKKETINPYSDLLLSKGYDGSLDKIWVILITRMFRFANGNMSHNTGWNPDYSKLFETIGKYEALALIESLTDYNQKKDVINKLSQFVDTTTSKVSEILNAMLNENNKDTKLPNGNSQVIAKDGDDNYEYVYIREDDNTDDNNRYYLPNFNNFENINRFFSGDKLLTSSKMKDEFSGLDYHGFGLKDGFVTNTDDGSFYGKFYTEKQLPDGILLPSENDLLSNKNTVDGLPNELRKGGEYSVESPAKYSVIKKFEFSENHTDYVKENISHIFNSKTLSGLNDLRLISMDETISTSIGENETVSSSIFFYKNGDNADKEDFTFWHSTVPIKFETTYPSYSLLSAEQNRQTEYFSPLCYADDVSGVGSGVVTPPAQPIEISETYDGDDFDISNSDDSPYTVVVTDVSSTSFTERVPVYKPESKVKKSTRKTIQEFFNGENSGNSENIGKNRAVLNLSSKNGGVLYSPDGNNITILPTLCTFGKNAVQLFGSELYVEQAQNKVYQDCVNARAYLFLRMLPLVGNYNTRGNYPEYLHNGFYNQSENLSVAEAFDKPLYNSSRVRDNLLSQPGLKDVPYAWLLAIGAEQWKRDNTGKIKYDSETAGVRCVAGLGDTPQDESNWLAQFDAETETVAHLPLRNGPFGDGWSQQYDSFNQLPYQFKKDCKEEFLRWAKIETNEPQCWTNIRKIFEILDFDSYGSNITSLRADWRRKWKDFTYSAAFVESEYDNSYEDKYTYEVLQPYIKNEGDFEKIKIDGNGDLTEAQLTTGGGDKVYNQFLYDAPEYRYDYNLIINRKNISANNYLFKFLNKKRTLAQTISFDSKFITKKPKIFKGEAEKYLEGFIAELKEQFAKNNENDSDSSNKLKKELFGNINDDSIYLNIYRQLSAVYNKWVAGSQDDLSVPCVFNVNTENLIDRFRFIDRGYNDIGNSLIINPFDVIQYLTSQLSQSVYDLIGSKILANNNMDFIPMPTFINFRKPEELRDMFETYTYKPEGGFEGRFGPSFVCMYVGQTSQYLDLGEKADYMDDSFDFTDPEDETISKDADDAFTLKTGKDSDVNIPKNTEAVDSETVPVFVVKYGDQNQSIFQNINLDQAEFSETDESLRIIDEMTKNQKDFIGQNLFNVYSVRSYSCEVECLGNLNIQPFMYFQLDNIPMFHGAYMIIKVSHEVQPHHVTTKFKGVRIRRIQTPLISRDLIYLNILTEFTDDTESVALTTEGPVPDYNRSRTDKIATGNGGVISTTGKYNLLKLNPYFNYFEREEVPPLPFEEVNTIVIHSTAGFAVEGSIDTLFSQGTGYHFIITKEGDVIQGTELNKKAGHAGISYGPKGKNGRTNGYSLNNYSVGISLQLYQEDWLKDSPSEKPTSNQIATLNKLIGDLKGWNSGIEWVTMHHYIAPNDKQDIFYFQDDLRTIAENNGLKLWLTGMDPFISDFPDQCIKQIQYQGVQWCTKTKDPSNIKVKSSSGKSRIVAPDYMVLPNNRSLDGRLKTNTGFELLSKGEEGGTEGTENNVG